MGKRILFWSAFTLLLLLLPISCTKAPINGALDGQWEVVEVSPTPTEIIIDQRLFYNFSLQVCDLTYYGSLFTQGNMVYTGETLWLEFPFVRKEKDIQTLKQYGILTNPVTFNVEFKDKHHLILYNDDSTVELVKH
ncbi:MAG: lipocalin-like domain-containing protein [Muribaculaceae bacterium]|nr:lipocalin-like domain-containing protein [Muribaculaceae bacterium]